jgi:hypothetical protein
MAYYLRGRYLCDKDTREGVDKGIKYFEQAIQQGPSDPLPYAGLANCYVLLSTLQLISGMRIIWLPWVVLTSPWPRARSYAASRSSTCATGTYGKVVEGFDVTHKIP